MKLKNTLRIVRELKDFGAFYKDVPFKTVNVYLR